MPYSFERSRIATGTTMQPTTFLTFSICLALVAGAILTTPDQLHGQADNPFGRGIQQLQFVQPLPFPQQDPMPEPEEEKQEPKPEDEGPVTDTRTLIEDTPQVPDNFVRFHMWDGTIVAGEVQIDKISIKTEFGLLEVPIERIRKLFPGLDSIPEMNARIIQLVERLGDKDFEIREKSHRELSSMGMQIRDEIDRFDDGGSAERKKRLTAIKQEINEAMEEFEEESLDADRSMIRGDLVATPEFEIVGKIQQESFSIDSKFGQLSVNLSDIRMAERSFDEKKQAIRKTVTVGGEKFFQRQPVSTRIRVNKGDKISIKADGVVQWTNWSTTSSPEGMSNQGQYQGITSGALCARIGSNGQIIKVGSQHEWTAKKSGVLYLGVAMQDNYVKQGSYRWTGDYRAKVQIKPTEND